MASADVIKLVDSNPTLGSAYFLAALALLNENKANEQIICKQSRHYHL